MSLICLSYAHQHVPIAFRERVHFDPDSIANACARFRCGTDQPTRLFELLILSTCNRTEIFAVASENDSDLNEFEVRNEILQFVAESRGIELDELTHFAKWYPGQDAITHLSRVACGIESLVLGEPQILGQVGDAMRTGLIMNSAGVVLTRMFQSAIKAGRRARSETAIGENSLNVSTVAVNTAQKTLGQLAEKTVVILGAGEMAELALQQLKRAKVKEVHVVNRTLEAARHLANQFDGQAHVFEQINQILPVADILISSTGAPHTLISRTMLEFAMQNRTQQKMFVLDIAVPRDIDPEIKQIPNVELCDIDDLHMVVGHSAKLREDQIPDVESIIEEETESFFKWYRGVGVESIIVQLRKKSELIRQKELERLKNLLPEMAEENWQVIERFSKTLVNKLLHDPTSELRKRHGTRGAVDHAEAIRELFQLELMEAIREKTTMTS